MKDALRAEWLRMRTTRTLPYSLGTVGLALVICTGYSWYVVDLWEAVGPARQAHMTASPAETFGLLIVPICMGVFGALVAGSEYSHGSIRTALVADPDRRRLVVAKALLVTIVAIGSSAVCYLTAYLIGQAIVGERVINEFDVEVSAQVPFVLAQSLSVGVVAVVGLALGFLLRSTAAAITAIVITLFPLRMVIGNLPDPWNDRIASFLLTELPTELVDYPSDIGSVSEGTLPPVAALIVMAGYVGGAIGLAVMFLRRRDI